MKRYILLITIFICILCTGCTTKKNNNDTTELDSNREFVEVNRTNIGKYLSHSTSARLSIDKKELIYSVTVKCKSPYVVAEEITVKIKVSFVIKYKTYHPLDQNTQSKILTKVVTIKLQPNKSTATTSGEIETNLGSMFNILSTTVTTQIITLATGVIAE